MSSIDTVIYQTFKNGSRTYFYSSVFFPRHIKYDVYVLYSFVRKADNFVDVKPQQKEQFYTFQYNYHRALNGEKSGDIIIDSFVELVRRKNFNQEWVEAFLTSMEMDIVKNSYSTIEETLQYIYGSAEVIGLMMATIMELNVNSHVHARHLGRAMQYINFIRDIDEDLALNRYYLPLKDSGLCSLSKHELLTQEQEYKAFIHNQIQLYHKWQEIAEQGYHFIPKRYLVPIKTAADMYKWTARKIQKNPFIVYSKKVKPSMFRIVFTIIKNSIKL